jgi:hypothetical protein
MGDRLADLSDFPHSVCVFHRIMKKCFLLLQTEMPFHKAAEKVTNPFRFVKSKREAIAGEFFSIAWK